MLTVSLISKRFAGAEDDILKDVTFTTNAGERVGLIGPNGSGKSTLLKIVMGMIEADRGTVQFTVPNIRVGYLAQGITYADDAPVRSALFPNLEAIRTAEAEVERLATQMANANNGNLDALMTAYGEALEQLETLGYGVDEAAGMRALVELGLEGVTLDDSIGNLSGGQKTRLILASMLVEKPHLLVLDEPTNHLDVTALEWLENWLNEFEGGVLVVSHDRAFIDRIVNRIVALDAETHLARVFVGTYTEYMQTLQHERQQQYTEWKDQLDTVAKMQADINYHMSKAINRENATVNDFQRGRAKVVAPKAMAKKTRVQKYVESDDRVEKPGQTWQVKMEFDHVKHIRGDAIRLENLSVGYDVPLLAELNVALRGQERVAIMGPNGHGKSTLLKTIIGELQPLAGRVAIGGSVQVGYLAQEQEILDARETPLTTIQREARMSETEARSFLHYFLFGGDDPLRPNSQLSYGERARLMLARLVAKGANLLVMDEPLNHLDLPSREQFEAAVANFPGSMLAVVHDRYFVDKIADSVWHVEDGKLNVEHLRV
ncbi:MAG: ABC-F family ATP-binding cassette domain-containing protein [Aggregatilineales bacterium]